MVGVEATCAQCSYVHWARSTQVNRSSVFVKKLVVRDRARSHENGRELAAKKKK